MVTRSGPSEPERLPVRVRPRPSLRKSSKGNALNYIAKGPMILLNNEPYQYFEDPETGRGKLTWLNSPEYSATRRIFEKAWSKKDNCLIHSKAVLSNSDWKRLAIMIIRQNRIEENIKCWDEMISSTGQSETLI